MKAVANCPIQNKIQLAALPPTSAAAREHCLRVYFQVQQWLGEDLPPTEWGWKLTNGQLFPVLTHHPPAPEKLLNLISCNCKQNCERLCGCKKAGLFCTALCSHCRGNGCTNSEEPILSDLDADSDHDFNQKVAGNYFSPDPEELDMEDVFEGCHSSFVKENIC